MNARRNEHAWFALGASLLLAGLAHAAPAGEDAFEAVQRAAERGEYALALQLAREDPDPLSALRAEVWLEYRARDFEASYAAAQRALSAAPKDLWLAERATAAAIWLRDSGRARTSLALLEADVQAADAAQREAFAEPLAQARLATEALVRGEAVARAAKARARGIALGSLATVAALLVVLALGLRRPA